MANGFGSLYVGSSGLQANQNALNVVANNLSNIDTKGYVRQQVIFEDRNYQKFDVAAIAKQKAGLGVNIADVIHYRDQFIDKTYRTAFGRENFYAACYEGTQEIETLMRDLTGAGYSDTVNDLYEVMAEFAKDPSDTANQSVLLQTSALWLEQTQAIYGSIKDYQTNLNAKIRDDVDIINKYADQIHDLNIQIQRIESAGVETAMDLRDARDQLIDELSGYASIDYGEYQNSQVWVKVEGYYLVDESKAYHMDTYFDGMTGFETPYWPYLSEVTKDDPYYKEVFPTNGIDSSKKNDVGELKALLLTRGDHFATYWDLKDITKTGYEDYLANSVALNTEAQFDLFVNNVVTMINNVLSPTIDFSESPEGQGLMAANYPIVAKDLEGNDFIINADTKVLDAENACYGSDGKMPPYELFTRSGCERFQTIVLPDGKQIFAYNEETEDDLSKCYTTTNIHLNSVLEKDPTKIPFKHQNGDIAYDMSERFETCWDDVRFTLSPSDTTPVDLHGFYVKLVGDLSNRGYVYKTNSETLNTAVESIWDTRQGVIGVSSDEELVNMIRFQNAYNASSRYMTVISQMIEHLVTQLGA